MVTYPCNVDPLTTHFYIVKLGFTGVDIIFLFLPTIYVLIKNKKNITPFHLKIPFLKKKKNCSLLHVIVKWNNISTKDENSIEMGEDPD